MLELKQEQGLIRIRAGGTLQSADYDSFVPAFEQIAERTQGTMPMVIELDDDFSGWDLGGLLRDLKFDAKFKDKFGRIAIVGTKTWEKWGTALSDPFFPSAELRYFDVTHLREAKSWASSR